MSETYYENMDNGAVDLAKVEHLLKTQYQPALRNMINTEVSPFYEKIRKAPLTGNKIKVAAPIGLNGGFGFGAEGASTPVAGGQASIDFEVDAVDMYVNIEISNKTLRLASNNMGSMVNVLDQQVRSSFAAAKWNLNRALFGNKSGIIANVETVTDQTTLVVDDVTKLVEGLTIDFYVSSANTDLTDPSSYKVRARIASIDRVTKTIKINKTGGTSTIAANDKITVQNSFGRELEGLDTIFNGTTIYGKTKADNAWLMPIVMDVVASTSEGINDLTLYDGAKRAYDQKNTVIDMVLMGDAAFRQYQENIKMTQQVISEKQRFSGGAVGYKVLVGNSEITVINDRFVPANEAYGVDTQAFTLYSTDWEFMAKDGAIFLPKADSSIYRALLASYGNIICENPGGCVKFTNCVSTPV
jgi:hypothetical protein